MKWAFIMKQRTEMGLYYETQPTVTTFEESTRCRI